jgi:hypothetical protein
MSADLRMVPISGKTAGDLLAFLGQVRATTQSLRFEADALCKLVGEAMSIAGDHRSDHELMCCELIAASNGASGRQIETVATWANVNAARDALEQDCAPVLGANVISLPRAPERDTAATVDAAVAKALLDLPGPISVRRWVDHVEIDPIETWAAPLLGEVSERGTKRIRNYLVRRVAPNRFEAFALTLCDNEECNRW